MLVASPLLSEKSLFWVITTINQLKQARVQMDHISITCCDVTVMMCRPFMIHSLKPCWFDQFYGAYICKHGADLSYMYIQHQIMSTDYGFWKWTCIRSVISTTQSCLFNMGWCLGGPKLTVIQYLFETFNLLYRELFGFFETCNSWLSCS